MPPRFTPILLACLALGLGAWVRFRAPVASPLADRTPALSGIVSSALDTSPDLSPTSSLPPTASPQPPVPQALGQGIVSIWQGRFDAPLRDLAPADHPPRDFMPPVTVSLPVGDGERIAVRIGRFDATGPDAGVFTGAVEGRPGSTVVLSYVGAAQAGVIYLPEEGRSLVINGGDDGAVRIITTDLSRAPGCAPEPPRPPLASL